MRTYKGIITILPENGVFVFGSNTQGRHGAGAAKSAIDNFDAIYGQPRGLQGKSYSIITKDLTKKIHPSISKAQIISQIYQLYEFAEENPQLDFYIAYSGKGKNLNGYSPLEMADMFSTQFILDNIIFEEEFAKRIKND